MTDDIVTRLREEYENLFSEWQIVATILPSAADEIENLRSGVDYWKSLFIQMYETDGTTTEMMKAYRSEMEMR